MVSHRYKALKPLLVSHSDLAGGGARAAYRLNKAFRSQGVESTMLVCRRASDDPHVCGPESLVAQEFALGLGYLSKMLTKLQKTSNPVLHSLNFLPFGLFKKIVKAEADVVNLHWMNNEAISVSQISRIRKPVVLTLHDMWAFCGAEHYSPEDEGARFRQGYLRSNKPDEHGCIDLDRWTWNRKKKSWTRPFHVICPSNWLAECARSSALMSDWPVHVVPNTLDLEKFQPLEQGFCRKALGLPSEVPLIGFGAIRGDKDARKGFDLLVTALNILSEDSLGKQTQCIIFGQSEPLKPPRFGIPAKYLGHLHDDYSLALLYNSVDVTVVPSRQENLPQVATEAQACGCPVVGFNVSGLPDAVVHGETGYLAKPYSLHDLADGIKWVLGDPDRHKRLSRKARERALELWGNETIVNKYLGVFESAIEDNSQYLD